MISDTIDLRPRYNEVDRMGYVYHANYITYCHIGRTELLRKFGINDKELEDHNIMLPVIDMHIQYKKPAFYDETLIVNTQVKELKASRCIFNFEIENQKHEIICCANSSVAFMDSETRRVIRVPEIIERALTTENKTK